jgi:predicted DNA-binding transcriptional regulator AlpA
VAGVRPSWPCVDELERLVESAPLSGVPALLGELERLRARAWTRLNVEARPAAPRDPAATADRLLTAREAAEILGVKERWVRDHADRLGGAVRLPGKQVRFSERKLRRWIDRQSA